MQPQPVQAGDRKEHYGKNKVSLLETDAYKFNGQTIYHHFGDYKTT